MSILAQAHGAGGGGGSGTVTSVGLSAPAQFSVTGSPVTVAGTLALAWASQTANTVLAAPDGSNGAPVFRALVAADIPALAYAASSHTHAAADTTTGVFDNARVNWASPSAIGSTTPSRAIFAVDGANVALRLNAAGFLAANPLEIWDGANQRLRVNYAGQLFASGRIDCYAWAGSNGTLWALDNTTFDFQKWVTIVRSSTATNTVDPILALGHNSSGTPTTGFGTGLVFQAKSSTTNNTQMGRLATLKIGSLLTKTGTISGTASEITASFTLTVADKAALRVGTHPYQMQVTKTALTAVVVDGTAEVKQTL